MEAAFRTSLSRDTGRTFVGDARHLTRLGNALGLSLLILFSTAVQLASADPFPDNYDESVADGSTHVYCYDGSVSVYSAPSYAMKNLGIQTDMVESYSSTCYSSTDVVWIEGDLAGNLRGSRVCTDQSNPGICGANDVTLDIDELNEGSNDDADRKKTACHELGHTLGLGHDDPNTDCMLSGEVPNADVQYRKYRSHVIDSHIDPQY